MPTPSKKVLFVSLSGIGNFLMQSPAWQQLKKCDPGWEITVWVAPRGTKVLAEADSTVTNVIEAPIKTSLQHHLQALNRLRREKFDVGVVLAPGQLIKSAAYLYLVGIPRRVGQTYRLSENQRSGFLLTDVLPVQAGLHDIEQNLQLAATIDQNVTLPSPAYALTIPPHHQEKAAKMLAALNLPASAITVGLHAGSAPGFQWKRWPLENFADAAGQLIEKDNAHILIFGGPDEEQLKNELAAEIRSFSPPAQGGARGGGSPVTIISTDLLTTAALMQHCRLVVANDSGLMHLASAAGATTLGLFGPTDEARIGPRGPRSLVLRAPGTKPVYDVNTNFDLGSQTHSTLSVLTPERVLKKINEILQ